MFEVVFHNGKILKEENFDYAMKMAGSGKYVRDEKGYKYFTDGTGDGFRSLKQSNKERFYGTHGIYDQSKLELKHVISNAKWIYYSFGLQESLAYIARIRERKESKQIKIIKIRSK